MDAIINDPQEIIRLLVLGLCPKTENKEALEDLGFQPENPGSHDSYYGHMWVREIDHGVSEHSGLKKKALQHAYLV